MELLILVVETSNYLQHLNSEIPVFTLPILALIKDIAIM